MDGDLLVALSRLGFSAIGLLLLVFLALLMSAYVKISTVLSLLRAGFGFFSFSSAIVVTGLAAALSFFVMYPTIESTVRAMDNTLKARPAATDQDRAAALQAGTAQWKNFLIQQTSAEDRQHYADLAAKLRAKEQPPVTAESLRETWQVLAPAFFVSQLRSACSAGLLLLLPFLVIDLLVSSILAAIGIENLNAHLVSLPAKLLVFVLADGWGIISTNLVRSYVGA